MAKRKLNQFIKHGYVVALTLWHRKFRPKHFTREAFRRYPGVYKPRAGERGNPQRDKNGKLLGFRSTYTGQKLRRWGHTNPLSFSGQSESLSRQRVIRATSKKGRAVIRAPALNRNNPDSEINMRREMEAVNNLEAIEMVEKHDRTVDRDLKEVQDTSTRAIG